MESDIMSLDEVADFLQRDAREVTKLADRGRLPGRKVAGQWRFTRAEINYWIETQLPDYDDSQLTVLESNWSGRSVSPGAAPGDQDLLLAEFLSERCVAVPLLASTRASVLRELVKVAEQSWQVYDPGAILQAIQGREEQGTTALPGGVALPHPHRPLPGALGESVLAYGRTMTGIPFGGAHGALTDVYFLVCCVDNRTHLRLLARLTRLLLKPGFLDELRSLDTPEETYAHLLAAERELLGR
jgi:PTS system nitrogen regulatory IIA component